MICAAAGSPWSPGRGSARTTGSGMNDIDEQYLRRAIGLALAARAAGQRPYGALLVGPVGEILAEEHNTVLADRDITAHPELKLARWAAQRLNPAAVRSATMYTSCQPCEMCAGAIARAGIGRVVFALSDEQWQVLTSAAFGRAAADPPAYEGPALFEEARAPIDGYDFTSTGSPW
jgi:tRNA(Arg) A34 adenosine deaminase TadA